MLPTTITQAYRMFQQEVPRIVKEHKVEFGKTKYKFAALHEIKAVVDPLLRKFGLLVKQISEDTVDYVAVRTILVFENDGKEQEWDMGVTMMPNTDKSNPQNMGKLITYCRRYALVRALDLSIVDECEADNDAQDHVPSTRPQSPSKPQKDTNRGEPTPIDKHRQVQRSFIMMCKKKGMSDELRHAVTLEVTKKSASTTQLNIEEIVYLHNLIEKKPLSTMVSWYEKCS